ncbi:1,4-dihydroxy-2-naphthoate polyprenyltransferase [Smaragdicoccus niigatensis]|uniref:1,4-dihydroxy-2-naphthoate polyprenyltransferase n=1 Tax=Smaragdicoccus niigatensis TaxID=359359 RepID=UPI00037CD984|nr:1,4-dihydroxy-2-naphthoate polyprenyltransferase [Smaragdicoccus niigatensis]
MTTAAQWIEGARPRTLPNAIAPVIAGTACAVEAGGWLWWKALLALVLSVSLIVGVNYANDYSDGIRGTDDDRVGPQRLVGGKLATPTAVRNAAFTALGIAAVAGTVLSLTSAWWLLLVGVGCLAGAWFYTGGRNPYGYAGFGEIAVFVFFGLVAVLGTQFVQAGRVDLAGLGCAIAVGCFSSAVLVTNNLRDIPTDTLSGKNTLAVRLGDAGTRRLHMILIATPFVISVLLTLSTPFALAGLVAIPLALRANAPVRNRANGMALLPSLRDTGLAMLAWSILTGVAFVVAELF